MDRSSSTQTLRSTTSSPRGTKRTSKGQLRLRGRRLFLTYPKCSWEPTDALEWLRERPLLRDMSGWIVAREAHADGDPHLHCYLELPAKLDNLVDPSYLNLPSSETCPGPENGFHPNVQGVRSAKAVQQYVTKESDYVTNLKLEETMRSKVATTWHSAYKTAAEEGVSSALELLASDDRTARDLCMAGDRIAKNLATRAKKKLKILHPLSSFTWTTTLWDPSTATTTLILTGPTGIGKTALAKALLPEALFVSHMDTLRQYGAGYDGVIFDDMAFTHLHREAQIHLVDVHEDRQIHVRYSVAELPAGTKRIVTTNRDAEQVVLITDPAINRRCTVIACEKVAGVFVYKKIN